MGIQQRTLLNGIDLQLQKGQFHFIRLVIIHQGVVWQPDPDALRLFGGGDLQPDAPV